MLLPTTIRVNLKKICAVWIKNCVILKFSLYTEEKIKKHFMKKSKQKKTLQIHFNQLYPSSHLLLVRLSLPSIGI